jgi:hypothetical protein
MLKKITLLMFLGLSPFAAQAAKTAPDVLGNWVGLSNSAVIGAGQHHPDGSDGEIRFRRVEFTLTIDRQEGRNFSGMFLTASHKEPVVGAFAGDFKTGVMADLDGQMSFRLVGKNRMDMCYTHTGVNNTSRVAACNEFVRK